MPGFRLPRLALSQVADPNINRALQAVGDVVSRVLGVEVINGHAIRGVSLTGSNAKRVTHGLGRTPSGWIVTDQTAAITLYRTAWDEETITLYPSATGSVDLWVF